MAKKLILPIRTKKFEISTKAGQVECEWNRADMRVLMPSKSINIEVGGDGTMSAYKNGCRIRIEDETSRQIREAIEMRLEEETDADREFSRKVDVMDWVTSGRYDRE